MKKNFKILYRISSLLLTLVIMLSVFCTLPVTASSDYQKNEKSYEIAVVFDNSGSMYLNKKTDWARAKYAMEIFASMLDYEKDSLTVYPMWEVTTDGKTPKSEKKMESTKPIEITQQSDIDKLSKMYTICALGTPFTPVDKAYKDLIQSTKSEKWLIVLTDGEFDGIGKNADKLKEKLIAKATKGIKVQYLGFGSASALKADKKKGFYTPSDKAKTLEAKLIEACNTIFQRSVLPANRLNGKTLNLDLSMRRVIVFVQGKGAKINSLTDPDGKKIEPTMDSKQRKYSDVKYGAGNYDCKTDENLFGHVVTFESCAKGKYKLDYTGSSKAIQIFYEPDVDVKVTLTNSDGEVVDGSSKSITANDYTVKSMIVDSKTGKDVTDHELMGKDVNLKTTVTKSDGTSKEYKNGDVISLTPDSETDIEVEGTYLKDYKISSRDNPDLDWLKGLKIEPPKVDLKLKATVLQKDSWYQLQKHDDWKPIKVEASVDGKPATKEQMEQIELKINSKKDIKYRCEKVADESAFYVYIGSDEKGNYVEPECGVYNFHFDESTYTDEYEKVHKANKESTRFEVQNYAKFWKWLRIVIYIALALALFLWWRYHKSFPKKLTLHERMTRGYAQTGIHQDMTKSFILRNNAGQTILMGTAKKNSPHHKRKKSSANFKLKISSVGADVRQLKIAGGKINLDEPEEILISDGDTVSYQTPGGAVRNFQIGINRD